MKSKLLNMSGCKTEEEFYKKYPTEKAFKKAFPNAFPKAQVGTITASATSMGTEAGTNMSSAASSASSAGSAAGGEGGSKFKLSSMLDPGMSLIKGLSSSLNAFEAEKEAKHRAQQMNMLTDLQVKAASMQPEEIKRKYVRPEDFTTSGSELFPVNGVGTNVLAKTGKNVYKKAQEGISTAASAGGESGIGSMLGGMGGSPNASVYGQIAKSAGTIGNMITGSNAGGAIGGTVGGAIGSIWGPQGQAIGQAAGSIIGGAVDGNPKKTKKYQEAALRNVDQMYMLQAGNSVNGMYGHILQNGGNVPSDIESGEMQTHWGGEAHPLSYNEFLPGNGETVMFKGQSHNESDRHGNTGIGITYGDSPVEVEHGEPALKLLDNEGNLNLTVFGDLKIPKGVDKLLGDAKARGKKFKNYVAELSKQEEKHNKLVIKSADLLDSLNPNDKADKVKIQSIQSNTLGARMKLKDIAEKKQLLSQIQQSINETSEQNNLNPTELAQGKIAKAQWGKMVKGRGSKWSYGIIGSTGNDLWDKHYGDEWIPMVNKTFTDRKRAEKLVDFIENTYSGPDADKVKAALQSKESLNSKIEYLWSKAKDGKPGPMHRIVKAGIDATEYKPTEVKETPAEVKPEPVKNTYNVLESKGSKWVDVANGLIPMLRPTDVEAFDTGQIMPEMYTLSTNHLRPVQAQGYQPLLDTPYDISYQDLLNENQADYRSSMRMAGHDPAAIAALNAQKYQANAKVLGEQFRANQDKKDQVYASNRNILNDAALKNLEIYDTQYDRQEQAIANTNATNFEALQSISDKQAKHALDMKKLGFLENTYNYRYDAAGRAINMNPLYNPVLPTVYNADENPNNRYILDKNGNLVGYQRVPNASDSVATINGMPELATPTFNGAKTNSSDFNYVDPELKAFDRVPATKDNTFTPYNPEEKLLEPTSRLDEIQRKNYLAKLFG